MKSIFTLLVLSLSAFAENENIRIFTPQDKVSVYVGKETNPQNYSERDFKTIQATKDWVQQLATSEPNAKYFWRESPVQLERIYATTEKSTEKNKTSNSYMGPIYEDQITRYDSSLPSRTYTEGQRVPEYDHKTGIMRYVPATYRYVEERATQDPGTNYFYRERREETRTPQYKSQSEIESNKAWREYVRKAEESLQGKPLNSLPSRPR